MAKLTTLKPRLSSLRSKLSAPSGRQAYDADRDRQDWRKWYKTKRWQDLRWEVLRRDLFTCQWRGCGRVEADTSQLVADHVRAHRGDAKLFWDDRNLQTLCKPCHDSRKQRQERRGDR
ncbi:HNH endonuclease [Sphingomonas panni]